MLLLHVCRVSAADKVSRIVALKPSPAQPSQLSPPFAEFVPPALTRELALPAELYSSLL